MSFDWGEYLNVADHLHDDLLSEASYRSGVSRSYYCVFGKTKLFCLSKQIITTFESRSSKTHALIPERLYAEEDESLFEIANRYEALKNRRLDADYDPFCRNFTQSFLQDTIQKSRTLLELLKDY